MSEERRLKDDIKRIWKRFSALQDNLDLNSHDITGTGNIDITGTIESSGDILCNGGSLVPLGVVLPYAGTSAPTNWLFCYGQEVSRTTYASLFAIISTTYGAGDASTTFNLPDLRGRVVAGQDDMGGTSANRLTNQSGGLDGDTLGASGGEETHVLTTAELAAHTHGAGSYETVNNDVMRNPNTDTNNQTGGGGNIVKSATTQRLSIQGTSGSTGSDTAHNNVQPTFILNYIIRALP